MNRLVGRRRNRWLTLEAGTFGLAYGAALCWLGVCLLGSFRPNDLSAPYWRGLPGLRSDTSGVLAFFVVAVCLCGSEFLRLRRRRANVAAPGRAGPTGIPDMALAVSETAVILATGLVVYLSVNAVTHPVTMDRPATHFASWPTEGTLRVIALLLCVCSAAVLRYLLAGRCGHARAVQPPAGGMATGPLNTACLESRDRHIPSS